MIIIIVDYLSSKNLHNEGYYPHNESLKIIIKKKNKYE